MRTFFTYYLLETKRSVRLFKRMLLTLGLLLLLAAAGIVMAVLAMNRANLLAQVKVAMVVPESEQQTKMVLRFASVLDSVQSICAFVSYDEETAALQALHENDVQACIVFPEHFYEDADNGVNTPAEVYVSDAPGMSELLFRGLLNNGVSLLQTAQAGVYATLDVADIYQAKLSQEEIGDLLLQMYVEQLVFGGRSFEQIIVSPYDTFSLQQYGFCAGLLLVLWLPGLMMGYFYKGQRRSLEQKLRLSGLNAVSLSVVRVCVIAQMLWMCFAAVYLAMAAVGHYMQGISLYFAWDIMFGAAAYSMVLACLFHGIYSICQDAHTGTVLMLFTEMLLFLGSGMLLPLDYMPHFFRKLAESLHMNIWSRYLLQLLYRGFSAADFVWLCLAAFIMFGIGVVGQWRSMQCVSGYFFENR